MPQSLATIPLAEFLTQPNIESSPAWEFIDGRAMQKPMPTLFHSRLQRNLVNYINDRTEQFEAVQELRCIIPPYSPVPDIAVIASERLGDEDGPFKGAPDWLIEMGAALLERRMLQAYYTPPFPSISGFFMRVRSREGRRASD